MLLHKHPRTIAREIQRGQTRHFFDEGLQKRTVYNADYAEHRSRAKDSGKGPQLKLGYDYVLAQAIGELMKEKKYSPYAVIAEFENKGWPTDTRICEKTLYNYIYLVGSVKSPLIMCNMIRILIIFYIAILHSHRRNP